MTAVFPPQPAVDSQQECCCRCACNDCILQLLTPFLHRTGQQRTCRDKHISGGTKKEFIIHNHIKKKECVTF